VLHGNLGLSVQFRQPVAGLIASRIPTTAFLCGYAAVLVIGGGLLLGAAGALAGRRLDQTLTVLLAGAAAVPSFVAGLGLIYLLAVWSHVLPSGGTGSGFAGQLEHMTLPAVALALAFLAVVARVTRQAMRDQMRREHVDMAVSRGLPRPLIVRRHIFWNALAPVSTVSALVLAGLITGTTVVEGTFGLNGVGSLLVTSVQSKDFPVVQGIVLLLVAVYVMLNTLVDLGYALLNPQVRTGGPR
jgi:peptide/nickel transport system permease protein